MKVILTNILALLLFVAVCVVLVWLLPVKVMLTVLLFTQFFTLAILGTVIGKINNHEQEAKRPTTLA